MPIAALATLSTENSDLVRTLLEPRELANQALRKTREFGDRCSELRTVLWVWSFRCLTPPWSTPSVATSCSSRRRVQATATCNLRRWRLERATGISMRAGISNPRTTDSSVPVAKSTPQDRIFVGLATTLPLFEVTSLFLLIVGLSDCSLFLLGVYLHHP